MVIAPRSYWACPTCSFIHASGLSENHPGAEEHHICGCGVKMKRISKEEYEKRDKNRPLMIAQRNDSKCFICKEGDIERKEGKFKCNQCEYEIIQEYFGKKLSIEDQMSLIRERKTREIDGFFSKEKKKHFKGKIVINDNGIIGFDFNN